MITHYEERLERDLAALRESVAAMAKKVQEGLANAVRALQTGDHQLASTTVLGDHPINRTMRDIDRMAHAFIAVHLPSAGHLRLLSSIIRVNIALERIGDYSVTIARVADQLAEPPAGHMARELERFANEAQVMLDQALTAFISQNAEMAKGTMVMAREMEFDLDGVYEELMANPEHATVRNLLSVFAVFSHLKRVADQAKNLCEEAVFTVTGETKAPKIYNILFVDEDNSYLSQMAEAIARKSFPGSGNYSSAGAKPAAALNAALVGFLEDRGIELGGAKPKPIELTPHELAEKHVIVSLQGPVTNYVSEIPFHTAHLEWDVGVAPSATTELLTTDQLETMYRELASRIRDLMVLLRGEDAP